jgi:hypothetical protein
MPLGRKAVDRVLPVIDEMRACKRTYKLLCDFFDCIPVIS